MQQQQHQEAPAGSTRQQQQQQEPPPEPEPEPEPGNVNSTLQVLERYLERSRNLREARGTHVSNIFIEILAWTCPLNGQSKVDPIVV